MEARINGIKNRFLLFTIAIIGIFLLVSVSAKAKTSLKSKEGILSFNHFPKNEIVPLNGEWEFYWQKLYTPEDFKQNIVQQTHQMVQVPNTWRKYNIGSEKLPLAGYATYRLQMEFTEKEIGTTKAIYMPSVSSAYLLWIDGEEKSKNGIVGKGRDLMEPESVPKVFQFQASANRVELVIQVSNYHQRKAGIFDSILIGEPDVISEYREKKLLYRSIIVMSLVVIGLYHVALFAFRKKEPSLIFFGIMCISVAIRATLLEEGLASYTLSFLEWELARKLEYLGGSIGIMCFSLFTYTQFSEDMNLRIRNVIIGSMSVYSLFIMITPAVVYTRTMNLFQIMVDLIFLYLIYVYKTAFKRKREGALLNIVAIIILFITALHDNLYFNYLVSTTELTSGGLLFFLFTQSIIISKRYSMSFERTEKLSQELAAMNTSLEQQVYERTLELQHINKELQVVNQKLNEAHQSRSKWIRNIYHEIASPLTGIRTYTKGMLDGVIERDQKYIQVVYDQSLYLSQMLHDLHDMADIENKEIKFDMKKVNIRIYIHRLYEKYKLDLEKLGIIFEYNDWLFEEKEDIYVLMDKIRIEQVIVNLLSNAKRFVKDDGKIVLELGKSKDQNMIIKVKDNGTGINETDIPLLFDRFYRSRTQGKQHNGLGLGLAISKEIVEYHRGTIGVESKEEVGSCFYFTLPVIKALIRK